MDHENLLPLRGYYYSKDEKLLLYDYMPLGSLSDQLHFEYDEWRRPSLSWEVRLSIALGAARAIEHLHAQRRPNDHHGNIKSSNVLLTPSYEPRVSDCGLALLTRSSLSGGPHPAMADVYGFGVFLLELLTGKRHTQPRLWEECVDLPAWVQSVAREEGTAQVLDVELATRHDDVVQGLIELLDVAMRCVSSNPYGRPWMSDVRKKIEYVLRNKLVLLGNPMNKFNLEDVLRASKQELGKGTFGTTYKADLKDRTTTVILKMLKNVVLSAEDFRDKVEAISVMDHENLLPLRGYFYSKDMKFLLYDCIPLGSLLDRLHPCSRWKGTALSWEVRLSIALGVARAIEHLHAQDNQHGNISSSKVLLMPSYEVRVSGYGLTLLTMPVSEGKAELRMADVYGFGELLLELLIGKQRTRVLLKEQGQGLDLPRWIQDVLRDERFADVFDVELMRYQHIEGGLVKLLEMAISCVSPNLYERPRMSEVRSKIEQLCSPGGQRDASSSLSPSSQVDRDLQLNQFSQVNNEIHPRKPPDGVLEVSERVYGDSTESVWGEEIAAVTESNVGVTSVSDSASSSAVNSGSVEATASGVSGSAQFPDMMLPKQEKLYQQNGSPSSASMSSGYDYDVFLSFRGPDTRSGITDFLHTSLLAAGIHTFKDDEELRVGEEFGPELLKAVSQSKVAIPILSKGYASSKWCLNELVQMMECSITRRQKVMPIFYDVSPAEVRHQIGSYEGAFLSHEDKFGANVSKWKAALDHIANLNGWDNSKKNRGEGELVDEIVQEVIKELKTA
ncbi:uncharacterized protein LOC125312561 [Rhodamnia argentea]|uniref:Uncharacterized protein LOC125312561 n=1 Tax=Rhodamnia argentea TaxID=178133 RepID=A0ABM3HBV5_9MYRT|nr:uncharacterized protein LOC125312561 [Rhodamnia argentea]